MEELFPIVDEEGCVIGKETRSVCHSGSMLLHPVVHVHVFNSKGELYLQQRALSKDIQPGKWDTSVGGHVDFGEEINIAAERETREELHIKDAKPQFLYKYIWQSSRERELVYVHKLIYDGVIIPDASELMGGKFWTKKEILQQIGTAIFTPNFEYDFQKLVVFIENDDI